MTLMESTPVSGVEIRNAVVAPLLAPCLLREIIMGRTEQEHSGRGMPKRDASVVDLRSSPPKLFVKRFSEMTWRRNPAINMPKRI